MCKGLQWGWGTTVSKLGMNVGATLILAGGQLLMVQRWRREMVPANSFIPGKIYPNFLCFSGHAEYQ